jgi:hypothetical protein
MREQSNWMRLVEYMYPQPNQLIVELGISHDAQARWTAADLIQAVIGLPGQPVVVLDALDECP